MLRLIVIVPVLMAAFVIGFGIYLVVDSPTLAQVKIEPTVDKYGRDLTVPGRIAIHPQLLKG